MQESRISDAWVIIACYNEAKVITGVLEDLSTVFQNILVIDDGSNDGTDIVLGGQAIAKVLTHPINLGQGASIATGLAYLKLIRAKFAITFDADGQHRKSDAVAMLKHLKEFDFDLVLGSRFLGKSSPSMNKAKKVLLRLATMFTRFTTGVKVTDAHNGLRVFGQRAIESIDLHQPRMAHASEIISELRKKKFRFSEFPVEVLYSTYSMAKGQKMSNSINIIFEIFEGRLR